MSYIPSELTLTDGTNNTTSTIQQNIDGNLSITNPNITGNIELKAENGVISVDTQIFLKGLGRLNVDTNNGNLFTVSNDAGPLRLYSDFPIITQCNTSNINFINDTGLFIKDRISDLQSNIKQQDDGDLLINEVNGSIILQSLKGVDIGNTLSAFRSKIFTDDLGDFYIDNPNGDIGLNAFGTVNINKPTDPQLNFINAEYPTQQCNIAFESATQELIMEHHSPDEAARCNIRLGVNDINIATFVGLVNPGDIHLKTGTGLTFINDYSLPNVNPTADGDVIRFNTDGTSVFSSQLTTNTTNIATLQQQVSTNVLLGATVSTLSTGNAWNDIFIIPLVANKPYFINSLIFYNCSTSTNGLDFQLAFSNSTPLSGDLNFKAILQIDNNTSSNRPYILTTTNSTILSFIGANTNAPAGQLLSIDLIGMVLSTVSQNMSFQFRRTNTGNTAILSVFKNSYYNILHNV